MTIKKELNDNNNQNKENININNNKVNIDYLDNFLDNEQYTLGYTNIYTLKGTKIISFNLFEKKFISISPKDKTNGVFNELITKKSITPIPLNTQNGFYILVDNYIF